MVARASFLLLPAVAILAGVTVATGVATAPASLLNRMFAGLGIAALLPGALSPISALVRALLALAAGGIVTACGLAAGSTRRVIGRTRTGIAARPDTPVVAHAAPIVPSPVRRPALIDPDDRFETFALMPPAPSIATRLDRLERSAFRRNVRAIGARRPDADDAVQPFGRLSAG